MHSISRRQFMALSSAAALTAALPRHMKASPMGLPVGIQLYTVSKPLNDDPAGTLKQLYAIGYREVESAGMAKVSTKELRKMIDDAGLKCPSAHLPLTKEDLGPAFEEAHIFGAHYAVSSVLLDFSAAFMKKARTAVQAGKEVPAPKLPALGLDGFKKMAGKMNEVGKKAKAAGLQYAYHNHNFEFEKMPDGSPGYDILLKETDPALVKFEVDCGWMKVAGYDPVAYMKNHPGRIKMLHIKDFKPQGPTTDLMGPGRPKGANLGTGFVDYRPIFAEGKAAGIEHIFDEQEQPFPVSQIESAKANFAYLEKYS
ncbi:MAG TPA: TIM barrel protein [Acidobacteriaceae bacterium]|nr:TIM barrel protein [Acidobacteriaceae bacterium]